MPSTMCFTNRAKRCRKRRPHVSPASHGRAFVSGANADTLKARRWHAGLTSGGEGF
jgi:hypothetical protein